MTLPQPHTCDPLSQNLLTVGDYQFAVWYSLAGELRIGRIERGVQRWGVDHDEYEFAGAPRTALGVPVTDDTHNYPAVMVDGNLRVHVWCNMHGNTLRAVRSTDPHTSDTWLATAGWGSATTELTSVGVWVTYPNPVRLPDGSLWMYLRDGPSQNESGHGDSNYWTRTPTGTTWSAKTMLFQGCAVPDAGGPGIPGDGVGVGSMTNWSAYPCVPRVESPRGQHPGRMHMCWTWRTNDVPGFSNDRTNVLPHYAYSDNGGATWRAIDGTVLTLPFTPFNAVAARVRRTGAMVRSCARGSNIVIATLDVAPSVHGLIAGDSICVLVQDSTYNGTTFTVGAVAPDSGLTGNQIAWGQAAADDAAGGVGSVVWDDINNFVDLAIDDDGYPHIIQSISQCWHLWWDGTAWQRAVIANPIGGVQFTNGHNCFWWRGDLWMVRTANTSQFRRVVKAINVTSGGDVTLSGVVEEFNTSFEPSIDPEAYRLHGTIEVLACDGNRPRVFQLGRGAFRRAA